jgi:hypothetical protein
MKAWLGIVGMAGLWWAGVAPAMAEPWVFRSPDGTAEAVVRRAEAGWGGDGVPVWRLEVWIRLAGREERRELVFRADRIEEDTVRFRATRSGPELHLFETPGSCAPGRHVHRVWRLEGGRWTSSKPDSS